MKKAILILIIIIVLALIGLGIYFFATDTPGQDPGRPDLDGGDPTTNTIESVGVENLFDFWVGQNSLFLVKKDGVIQKINPEDPASQESLSSLEIQDLSYVLSSPGANSLIVASAINREPQFQVFNTISSSWRSLPENTVAAAWSPNSESIAYLTRTPSGLSTVYVLDVSSGEASKITDIYTFYARLAWPTEGEIYLTDSLDSSVQSHWLKIDVQSGDVFASQNAFSGLWLKWYQPATIGVRFSSVENTLELINSLGETASALSLATLPSKCTIWQDFMYCGLPQSGLYSGFLTEYLQRQTYSVDAISKINTKNPADQDLLYDGTSQQSLDIYHPQVLGEYLYFINRINDQLYKVAINPRG